MSDRPRGFPTSSQLILTGPSGGHCRPSAEEMRARGVKKLAQGHPGRKGQSQGPKTLLFATRLIYGCIEIDRFRF